MPPTDIKRPVYYFPDSRKVPDRSLLHLSLTSIARMLDFEPLNDKPALLHIPSHLRQTLLSYVATYRAKRITMDELQILLDGWSLHDAPLTASCIQHLDLSGAIGTSLTFEGLNIALDRGISLDFASLTHLCLAYPGSAISWPSFLSFALQVPWLTHLSLAYWPSPSTSTVNSNLSSLSKSLTDLRYLDVEGCTDWIYLLCIDGHVDWTTSWKNLHSLNLSQGPMPIAVQFEGGPETKKWLQGEIQAREVEESINRQRRTQCTIRIGPLQVEHGYNPGNYFLAAVVESAWQEHQKRCCHRFP